MYYYGITIGPIIDTLSQASTPASLWYASYMFSKISEQICKKLTEEEFRILSPYYDEKNMIQTTCIGVGQYHDRILFEGKKHEQAIDVIENYLKPNEKGNNIIDKTAEIIIKDITNETGKVKSFLREYIQIKYIKLADNNKLIGEKGLIGALNYCLDCLELEKNIFASSGEQLQQKNPFQLLFYGHSKYQNEIVKGSAYFKDALDEEKKGNDKKFTLITEKKNIRSLADIAAYKSENNILLQSKKYYALVQADGDNMGKLIKSLDQKNNLDDTKDGLLQFSKKCFQYTSVSCDIIKDFGGTIIYAGGDDLLFLAPIQIEENHNIFTLLKTISDQFNEIFKEEITMQERSNRKNDKLSLSFGVAISYEKFPLYENFNQARNLLFGQR